MRTRFVRLALLSASMALLIPLLCLADETPSKEKIAQLIDKLGSGDFNEREKATKELSAIGAPALEALRQAAKSRDVEVRKRAQAILAQLDKEAPIPRVLAPKRVHLVYKDTPLLEALADFQKKSGYGIDLCAPNRRLKERKITLDTGETTFWHAAGLLCEKAQLTEGNIKDLKPNAKMDHRPIIGNARNPNPAESEHLILKDGKRETWPADDRGAIRVRAVGKYVEANKVPPNEVTLSLEISREPKLQWQFFSTIQIAEAVDDRGQNWTQVIPKAKQGNRSGFGAILLPAGAVVRGPLIFHGPTTLRSIGKYPGLSVQVPLQLRKGEKTAKCLAELRGFITAVLLAEDEQGNAKGQRAQPGVAALKRTTVNIPFTLKNVPLP